MKKLRLGKKFSALFLATVMSIGALSSISALATEEVETSVTVDKENAEIDFNVTRNDDIFTVSFDSTGTGDFAVLDLWWKDLASDLSYQSFTAMFPTKEPNLATGEFVLTGDAVPSKGESVFSVNYKLNSDFEYDKDYTFKFYIEEATNNDLTAHFDDLEDKTFTITYRESLTNYYDVTFVSNGTKYSEALNVKKGETVSAPTTNPIKANSTFQHWSTTENGSAYDFNTPVTGDLTLYAVYESTATTGSKNVDLSKVEISKTLNKDNNVNLTEEFTFKLEFVSLTPTNSNDQVTDKTTIPNDITANVTNTGSVNLTNADFPIGGAYEYKVTEVKGTNTDMIYDDSEYHLFLEIEEDKDGNLILDDVIVKDKDGKKTSLSFTNNYAPTDTLTVSKTVTGDGNNPYNKDKKFNFAITFTAAAVTNGKQIKVKVNGVEQTIAYGAKFEFTLGNGEQLEFTNIPEGTTYTLTESGAEYYTGSVVATAGSTEVDSEDGTYAKDLTISNIIIKDGGNKADVTNAYSITPPTGLLVHSDMLVILAVAVLALAGTIIVNRKLKKVRQ